MEVETQVLMRMAMASSSGQPAPEGKGTVGGARVRAASGGPSIERAVGEK